MTTPPEPDRPAGWRRHLLIPLAALIAVMPLLHHGCSCGHDFDFHLLSWFEAATQFSHGNLYPRWAFTPAFNAGEPRFVFYPPISWTLGALLGLFLTHLPALSEAASWNATPILFTWIAFTLSGLTMHRLTRAFVTPNAALLTAVLYLANPYMLFTAYERTAYAELLAAAWIPLLFLAILGPRVTIPRIALPIALLWLTNAPAAVMGSYALAFLALLRIAGNLFAKPTSGAAQRDSPLHLAFTTLSGTVLGFGLASFYIIPAQSERRFVQIAMATITGMRIDQNFLFEHTGSTADELLHDQVLHTASLIAILLLIAAAIGLAATSLRTRDRQESTFPSAPLAALTIGIAFLLTPLSLPIWNHAPQAAFLQFPWRLLALLAPIAALSVAAAFNRLPLKLAATAAVTILLAVALSHPAYRAFQQPCDDEDTVTARLALFHADAGTDPTDEYTPARADNDSLIPGNPPYWLADSPAGAPPAGSRPGPAPLHLALTPPRAEYLILNLRDYPAWHFTLNHALDLTRGYRPDGLVALHVPADPTTLDISYSHTPDQVAGDIITLLAVLIFLSTRNRPALHHPVILSAAKNPHLRSNPSFWTQSRISVVASCRCPTKN